MKISDELKEFLNEYIELVDTLDIAQLYDKAWDRVGVQLSIATIGKLTGVLYSIDINPLDYLDQIPSGFASCLNINSITIPNNIKLINSQAFYSCHDLEEVNLPESITYIDSDVFTFCNRLGHINIPSKVSHIGERAFEYCRSLESISIPPSVKYINSQTFDNCAHLRSVAIGNGVKRIGESAFFKCVNLKDIYYSGTKQEWNEIEKGDSWNSRTGDYIIHCSDGNLTEEN